MDYGETSIVFYCKDCGNLFFAAVNSPNILADCSNDIRLYLRQGHKMAEVPHETVRQSFASCKCGADGESVQLAEQLKLI